MFTKKELKELREDIDRVLDGVGRQHNLDIKSGNMSYSDMDATIKVEIKKKQVDGKPFEQAEFEKYCKMYGFEPEDYKKKFTMSGQEWTLIGFNPKAPKNAFIILNAMGTEYRLAKHALNRDDLK